MSLDLNKAKKYLQSVDWYSQAASAAPFTVTTPMKACVDMRIDGKKIPVRYEIILYLKDRFMEDFISKESLQAVAEYYFQKQKEDSTFISHLRNNWHEQYIKPLLEETKRIENLDLASMKPQEIFDLFRKYTEIYQAYWCEAIFLDSFDYYGEYLLEREMNKRGLDIPPEDLATLTTPLHASFLQKERLALLDIAEECSQQSGMQQSVQEGLDPTKTFELYPKLKNMLEKHAGAYHWIHNDYVSVDDLNADHFYASLRELLIKQELMDKERHMRGELSHIQVAKQDIIQKYNLDDDFIDTVEFLAILGNMRDERKSYFQQVMAVLEKFLKTFSRKYRVSENEMWHTFLWEVEKFLVGDKYTVQRIRDRESGSFIFMSKDGSIDEYMGDDAGMLLDTAKGFLEDITEVKGRSAFPGKIRGIVRIIRTKAEFGKMGSGDILFAPNTRPEYVPIMKIASAIVTEEGGITCHAAIVSRELKIPCVVGAQGVLSVVRDGDMVEVDANKGVVKIIKTS